MRVRCDITVLLLGISLIGLTTGCSKKVALAPPAPPPPLQEAPRPTPPGPTASITVEPPVIEAGQAVTLKWSTTNATEVTITAVGAVAVDGKQEVRPAKSTTYELVANGPGGSAAVSATVSVLSNDDEDGAPRPSPPSAEGVNPAGPAAALSYSLIGAIVFFAGLGYGLDRWQSTSPWGVVGGLVLGFVVGFYQLIKATWRK